MGAELLLQTIPEYASRKLQPTPQPTEGVNLAPKIKKQDGLIDWNQDAVSIWNRVRGLVPWPGAFTYLPPIANVAGIRHASPLVEGEPQQRLLKIWKAQVAGDSGSPGVILRADKTGIFVGCGSGVLRLIELQRESGRRLSAKDFQSGHHLASGWKLG
jgi:methionyl-tRNA formyltransferase